MFTYCILQKYNLLNHIYRVSHLDTPIARYPLNKTNNKKKKRDLTISKLVFMIFNRTPFACK